MRISKNEILYSASDLNKFLGCQHSVFLDYRSHFESIAKRKDDPMNELLQKRGDTHESTYWDQLREKYPNHIEIDRGGSDQEKADRTIQAMKDGKDVIFQGYLRQDFWQGYTDFLIKVPNKSGSRLGDWSYEVWDTKLARQSSPKYILQLCLYSWMIEKIQGVMPESMHVVLSGPEGSGFNPEQFRVADHISYFNQVKLRFEAFTGQLNKESAHPDVENLDEYPWPCNQCKFCAWTPHCEGRWEEDSALSLVANIRRGQAEKLHEAGIHKMSELAEKDPNYKVEDIGEQSINRLINQAKLQQEKVMKGISRAELIPCPGGKGFDRLPKPAASDLFFDMEGDPLYPNGLEYLFGVYYRNDSAGMEFTPFWGHDHDQERQAFIKFMDFIKAHIEKHPESYIYHYNHYETTALKRLAGRYKAHEETLDNLLRQGRFIDLYAVVREAIQTTEPGYSIKNLEAIYWPDNRNTAVANAADSIIVYNQWRNLDDSTDKEKLLTDIAEYNRIDCESTFRLRDWLLELSGKQDNWFIRPIAETNPESKSPRISTKKTKQEKEAEYNVISSKIMSQKTPLNEKSLERLVNILEFHNREEKSQWWSFFEREQFNDEMALESLESIGAAKLIECMGKKPGKNSSSYLYKYSYPLQDFKIKENDSICLLVSTVKLTNFYIESMNEKESTVILKSTSSEAPELTNIILGQPRDNDSLREAIYRVARRHIAGEDGFEAIWDILIKKKPRFNSLSSADSDKALLSKVLSLASSYMIVQGPPGTGKTHSTAECIIDLLKRGYKVGISANSHKAIHNVLQKIEEMAVSLNLSHITGIKKSNGSGNNESHYSSEHGFIENSAKISFDNFNLIAGTAWCFAGADSDDKLDYLFIDEAGQVSLANVVAMGTSAKNIVLVGDQMQLEQPIQGSHPDEIGMSALEFLLDGEHTVPDDMGVFLATTWRLRPEICKFISDAVYDGRLVNEKSSESRSLEIPKSVLPESCGIILKPIKHHGSTQKSDSEAQYLVDLYNELLGCQFHDLDEDRLIGIDDILVVAPYNVQVNNLKSLLPDGARVGTIDKFQGQEAPIVLISMTTSSPEDIPRGMEFLYSKNRLNVALSRAQCLAVMAYSPKLLDAECRTVLQTNLVNTFCWLNEYADKGGRIIH